MNKSVTLKRLFNEYTKKYLKKIAIAVFFSLLVAASTSSIAWLLDPAIEKIFIQKDQSLLIMIPFLIIIAFTTKGFSLYLAKVIMINVGEDIKKKNYRLLEKEQLIPSDENRNKYRQYNYLLGGPGGNFPAFTEFQIKIVLTSTNSAKVPVLKDLRAIALSV